MPIKEKIKYIYYSDIESLEIFQSALLILVNPINLYQTKCMYHDVGIYLVGLGISCIITGLLNLIYLFKNNLKQRLNVARLHLIITLTICLFLTHCTGIKIGQSLIIYYWIQTFTCLFVASRLLLEVKHKNNQRV